MSNTILVTISGSYRSANRQIESFDAVTGVMPALDEDKATQMAIKRYAKIWIAQEKNKDGEPKYKHIQNIRQVFIDSIEDNEEKPDAVLSYVGKNIMEMNFEEIQDLAAANDLSGVPLYRVGSLTTARRIAWSEYAVKVLKLEEYADEDEKEKFNLYVHTSPGFNPHKFEPIFADGEVRRFDQHRLGLEEGMHREAKTNKRKNASKQVDEVTAPNKRMTFEQLKTIATQRNIAFNKGISFENLYKKVYGSAAA